MTSPIEGRLRAHFADRAAREPLPGPEADTTLRQAREGASEGQGERDGDERGDVGGDMSDTGRSEDTADTGDSGDSLAAVVGLPTRAAFHRRPRVWLAVAAVCVVVAGVAGALMLDRDGGDDGSHVSTDGGPGLTEPEPDTGPEAPPVSSAPVPTTVPEATATTTGPPSAPSPTAGTAPSGLIVSLEGVLGTWSGSGWVQWEVGAAPPVGDEYQVVRLDEAITTAVGREGVDCTPEGLPSVDVGLRYGEDRLAPLPIAVAGVTDPRPRLVEVLDPSAVLYREATSEVVSGLGIDDPSPQVRQVVRGDLDGDGATEVVVVADRISDPVGWETAEGDYAVAFLRRVVGGEVVTSVLASWIGDPAPGMTRSAQAYRVSALADLNGDARMEVVLNLRYWEGASTLVHEVRRDGSVPQVLRSDCGH